MIQSFRSRDTEAIFKGFRPARLAADCPDVARRKLLYLDLVKTLTDLRVPPGNRLEALHGDRAGQSSIRINERWRICFAWGPHGPEDVEIVDYH